MRRTGRPRQSGTDRMLNGHWSIVQLMSSSPFLVQRAGRTAIVFTLLMSTSYAAQGHAFGSRYELSIPIWLFVVGGAVTVTATFLLVSVIAHTNPQRFTNLRYDLQQHTLFRFLVHRYTILFFKCIAIALLGITVLAGFVGSTQPNHNISPTLVWAIWWAGFSYFTMLIGNPWPVLNPWQTLFNLACSRADPQLKFSGTVPPYPPRMAAWPAVALFLVFSWIELVFPFRADPFTISILIVSYSIITWTGMYRYGGEAWLKNADPFSVIFALYAKFAPLASDTTARSNGPGRRLILRPFGSGLLQVGKETMSLSLAALILAMLAAVLFDGLLGSAYWLAVENFVHELNPKLGDVGWILVHTAALLAIWIVFLGMYLGTCAIMSRLARNERSTNEFISSFALTLIPIVVGYHIAHTFPFLIVQGQYIIPLLSDPFGYGWNIFGTSGYRVDVAIMSTKTAWYLAVVAIVAGHVISVYLAHVAADRLVKERSAALRSLIPMTVLMVIYTIVSLSILAEPLVKYSGPNEEIIRLPTPLWRAPVFGGGSQPGDVT
jgi:hypothetical protein